MIYLSGAGCPGKEAVKMDVVVNEDSVLLSYYYHGQFY